MSDSEESCMDVKSCTSEEFLSSRDDSLGATRLSPPPFFMTDYDREFDAD